MANYQLIGTDNVQEYFTFELSKGLKYQMAYPTMEELEALQLLTSKIREAAEAEEVDTKLVEKLGKEQEAMIHSFITPIDHETPLEEALKKENVRVVRNFSKMLQTELSIG